MKGLYYGNYMVCGCGINFNIYIRIILWKLITYWKKRKLEIIGF